MQETGKKSKREEERDRGDIIGEREGMRDGE